MNSFIKKNWFVCVLIALFAVISVYYIYDTNKGKLKGKTANGEDVVYSVNNTDVTASMFYDDMYKNNGTGALAQAMVRAITSQSTETTEEMKSWAKNQASNVIANYQSSYPSNYKEMISQNLQSMGYSGFEDLEEYLVNYQKQQKLLGEYADAHFDELKIRNISYLLIQFENGDSGEGTPTEDEQKRMDAVDAAFKEGKSFADVAKEFSEDTSSASSGGVLGVVDKNTSNLDQAFLDAAMNLKEGETSDWIYSSNFGYFRIRVNAATPENLMKVYKEQNSILEGTVVEMATVYETLLDSYDTNLASRALWEKGQELGVTFTDPEAEASLKKYMGVEE